MKKVLLVFAVAAMVATSCGMKSNAQGEETTESTSVEAVVEEAVAEETAVADSTACTDAEKKACCEKDSTAKECPDAEK